MTPSPELAKLFLRALRSPSAQPRDARSLPFYLSAFPGFLCAYLCDLCVSAVNRMPVWLRLRRVREWLLA
jgi:hypothetical protein